MWACPILADRAALARHVSTWSYEFADPQAQPFIDLPADPPPGASHASELPNLFEVAGRKPISSDRYTDAQRELAKRMVGHWTAFAGTGDPGWTRGAQRSGAALAMPTDGSTLVSLRPAAGGTLWPWNRCAWSRPPRAGSRCCSTRERRTSTS
jgi:carboxylesterase type B